MKQVRRERKLRNYLNYYKSNYFSSASPQWHHFTTFSFSISFCFFAHLTDEAEKQGSSAATTSPYSSCNVAALGAFLINALSLRQS